MPRIQGHCYLPLVSSHITGLGTAVPQYAVKQDELCQWLCDFLDLDEIERRRARWYFERSGVERRYLAVPDVAGPGLYRRGLPTLTERMRVFRDVAPRVAAEAATCALAQARLAPEEVDHLIVVTCTGVYVPGPDVDLVRLLGLRTDVHRSFVSMMGCSGAFHGLRVARDAVEQTPSSKALLVCVELASTNFEGSSEPNRIISNALFGDGAAAAVVEAQPERSLVELGESRSVIATEAAHVMRWDLTEHGFQLELSPDLPEEVRRRIRCFVDPLTERSHCSSWVVHPGGPAILRAVAEELDLPEGALGSAFETLREYGNLSSATALFVLERELRSLSPGQSGIMIGMGPGLALEACLFDVSSG